MSRWPRSRPADSLPILRDDVAVPHRPVVVGVELQTDRAGVVPADVERQSVHVIMKPVGGTEPAAPQNALRFLRIGKGAIFQPDDALGRALPLERCEPPVVSALPSLGPCQCRGHQIRSGRKEEDVVTPRMLVDRPLKSGRVVRDTISFRTVRRPCNVDDVRMFRVGHLRVHGLCDGRVRREHCHQNTGERRLHAMLASVSGPFQLLRSPATSGRSISSCRPSGEAAIVRH